MRPPPASSSMCRWRSEAARLAARNRQCPQEVRARLERVVSGFLATASDLIVDNSGPPERAAQLIVGWLQERT
jgi:ribose 1,5-bisphosphokinase PhnN